MATAFPDQLLRRISDLHVRFRRPLTAKPAGLLIHLSSRPSRNVIGTVKKGNKLKWAVRLSLVEEERPPPAASGRSSDAVEFLYEDLPHLFDEQGIDRTMYDDRVRFRDPITKHDTIDGYLFNIRLLKLLFRPSFQLHHVKQVSSSNSSWGQYSSRRAVGFYRG